MATRSARGRTIRLASLLPPLGSTAVAPASISLARVGAAALDGTGASEAGAADANYGGGHEHPRAPPQALLASLRSCGGARGARVAVRSRSAPPPVLGRVNSKNRAPSRCGAERAPRVGGPSPATFVRMCGSPARPTAGAQRARRNLAPDGEAARARRPAARASSRAWNPPENQRFLRSVSRHADTGSEGIARDPGTPRPRGSGTRKVGAVELRSDASELRTAAAPHAARAPPPDRTRPARKRGPRRRRVREPPNASRASPPR